LTFALPGKHTPPSAYQAFNLYALIALSTGLHAMDAEKIPPHDASNDLPGKKYNEQPSTQDDAASSLYQNNDEKDVEKAQAHDTTDEFVQGRKEEAEKDPNVVDFDGDNDPECALNWPTRKKWTMGGLLSAMTFVTYVYIQSTSRP
jgi:hypothetical protein